MKYWIRGEYILFEVIEKLAVYKYPIKYWMEYKFSALPGNHKRVSPSYSRFKNRFEATHYGIFPDDKYRYDEFRVYPGPKDL